MAMAKLEKHQHQHQQPSTTTTTTLPGVSKGRNKLTDIPPVAHPMKRPSTQLDGSRNIFITEPRPSTQGALCGLQNRPASSRVPSQLGGWPGGSWRGSQGEVDVSAALGGGGSGGRTVGTLQASTRARNSRCDEAMTLLDACPSAVGHSRHPAPVRGKLAVIDGDAEKAQALDTAPANGGSAETRLKQAFDECNSLLDLRGLCMQNLIVSFNQNAPGLLDPAALSYGGISGNLTGGGAGTTSAQKPHHHPHEEDGIPAICERTKKASELQQKLVLLRADARQRVQFAEEVDLLKRARKEAQWCDGRNHLQEHAATVGDTAKSDARADRREAEAAKKARRIKECQATVKALTERKADATLRLLSEQAARLEHRRTQASKASSILLRCRVWTLMATVARSVEAFRDASRTRSAANMSEVLVSDPSEPMGIPMIHTSRMKQTKVPVKIVFIRQLKRCVATKKAKSAIRDWIYVCRIPHALSVYMRCVRSVQRGWRALQKSRHYRRMLCGMQWDQEVDDLVKQVEKKKQHAERERYSAEKMQDAQGKKACETRLNSLMRDKGELRGIPHAVKSEIVDAYVREKESVFGERVRAHLKTRDETKQKVAEWIHNNKFMLEALRGTQVGSKRTAPVKAPAKGKKGAAAAGANGGGGGGGNGDAKAGAKPGKRVESDDVRTAMAELLARGEVVHTYPPVFPLTTPRHQLHAMINSAKEASRTLVMKRLAENDLRTDLHAKAPKPDEQPPPPAAAAAPTTRLPAHASFRGSPRQSVARQSVAGLSQSGFKSFRRGSVMMRSVHAAPEFDKLIL